MTREEAITLMKSAQLMLVNPKTNEPISDLYEALDMAIKALEQEQNRQGKWIFEEVGVRTQVLKCSECGTIIQRGENFTQEEFEKYINDILREKCITLNDFCHNCGARMRTESEDV